jgi:hypothetical protein
VFTRRALLAPGLGLALAFTLVPGPAFATPERQVILVVTAERSYGQALGDPLLIEIARGGGLGLVTTSGGADDAPRTAVNLGAGRSALDAPSGAVPFEERDGGLTVDAAPYGAAAGDAVPGLLGSSLSQAGLAVGYIDPGSEAGEAAMLTAMDRDGSIPSAYLDGSAAGDSLPDEVSDILRDSDLLVLPDPELLSLALEDTEAGEVLLVVVGAGASEDMRDRGDAVAPIVVARGAPAELLAGENGPTGLTSSTTRLDGVVSDVDVAPTILDFLGVPVPGEMVGAPIRFADGPPSDLHERYLEYRGVVGPVGAAILALGLISLVAGLAVVFLFRHPAQWLAGAIALAVLASLALFVAMTPASILPTLSYATVTGCLVAVAALVLTISLLRGRRDPRAAVATAAVSGLVVVVLDGVFGWPSRLTPLLGGGALGGERFFGLGNAHAGIVLAGAVLGAARLPPRAGVWLITAAAAFAGLPFLGADLGGCLTLAIAAALWFGLQRWRNLGWRTWALVAAVALGTLVLVAIGDRVLPGGQTHLSQVADGEGGLGAFIDRLVANTRATSANASAWLAVLGLPVWAVVALRRPGRLRPTLEPDPRWRDAVVVLALAGIAGYLLNDTYGLAGSSFAFVSAAMLYPTLVSVHAGGWVSASTSELGGLEHPTEGS